jgi:Taurine catabolism dioxygenase TauD, TfdA family
MEAHFNWVERGIAMDVIESPANWTSKEIVNHADFYLELSESDTAVVLAALTSAKKLGRPLFDMRKDDFPVDSLAPKLEDLMRRLETGIGAVVVRGLDLAALDLQDCEKIFWCLGQHLGTPMSQSDQGDLMMSIMDVAEESARDDARGVHSRHPLEYHTDLCDVVAMLSLQNAYAGGESMIVSSLAVHNEMARTRPDLLLALYSPVCYAQPRWDSANDKVLEMRPVFAKEQGHFVSNYLRDFIAWAQEDERAPRLTDKQTEALDYLDKLCNDRRFSLKFMLRPGEMLFINNFLTYHSRMGFQDTEEMKRLLLRLWLSVPNSRPLPESYRTSYRAVKAGATRGGIYAEDEGV